MPDVLTIPQKARAVDIDSALISTRLKNVLYDSGYRCLGDLHGVSTEALLVQRNFGRGCLAELLRAIEQAEAGKTLARPRSFVVPENIHALKISDLPFSCRARNVFNDLHLACLGDFNGMAGKNLQEARNCGNKTVNELWEIIERAIAGDFFPPDAAEWKPETIIAQLDASMAQLPERKRSAITMRLGAETGDKKTMHAIGESIGVKGGRVAEIIRHIPQLSVLPLKAHLELLQNYCRRKGSILSPELLGQWAGTAPRRYSMLFYVRLISILNPDIPVADI